MIWWEQSELDLKCNFISQHFLQHCQDKIVLEIGCYEGWITERVITHNPSKLILLESHKPAVDIITEKFPQATIIHGDMHEDVDLNQAGKVDVALVLGVIYHSHAPLHALEKLINICNPGIVILDNMDPSLSWKDEKANNPGMRNTVDNKQTCDIVITLSNEIITKAMENLGYALVKQELYPRPSQGWGNPIFQFERQL